MELQIFESEGVGFISSKELYEKLGIKIDFEKWIKDKITRANYLEDKDYLVIDNDYLITQKAGLSIILDCLNLINDFQDSYDNGKYYIKKRRKELEFKDLLLGATGMKFKEQYPIDNGKYKLDFYLEGTLIVEYDEKHHNHKKDKDHQRIEYCRRWLAKQEETDNWLCPVIRVKEGEEIKGLNRIIRHLVGFEKFKENYNYKLEVCDYKNS